MRAGITPEILAALGASEIITALVVRLEFKSETVFLWTGTHPITATGSGDTALDGHTFEPLANGVVVDIGEMAYSYTGSDAFEMAVAIPTSTPVVIAAAEVFPSEYQSRLAIVWRALMIKPADPTAPPQWVFKRIRTGAMDQVEISNDGQSHTFKLVIESHQARISQATNQTYLDQKRYDPADTSQDYSAAIANGKLAPAKGANPGSAGGGGGYYGGGIGGGFMGNVQLD